MSGDIAVALRSIRHRNLKGIYAEDREEAKTKILGLIQEEAVVGIGDSTTVSQIGVMKAPKERGTKVLDAFEPGIQKVLTDELVEESTICDVFLTGTNAVTPDRSIEGVGL